MDISFQMKTQPSYMLPKKNGKKKGLWIFLFIIIIVIILAMIKDGNIGTVFAIGGGLGIFRVIYIIRNYARRAEFTPSNQEMAVVKGNITKEQTRLCYRQMNMKKGTWENITYLIDNRSINLLEFSNELNCLRICANITRTVDEKPRVYEEQEHYLYIEQSKIDEILENIQSVTNVKINYIDR